ncbi:hypothetical protein hairong_110 [Pseudomonas phage hairong]|nr:hypothetical protein hairong_110 [Pseudomonas phage hairong]
MHWIEKDPELIVILIILIILTIGLFVYFY